MNAKKQNIIEKVKKFVEGEYKKPTAHYGYDSYPNHLIPMHDYAKDLAKRLGADIEIVEIAAWLHDIGSCVYGRENHHITGAKIAEEKLRELGYSKERIDRVKECILSHRSSNSINGQSLEAKIISDADAISNFDNLPGIFLAAYVYEKQNQQQARRTTKEKLERKWKKLYLDESKKLIKPKYEAAMLLLSGRA